MKKIIISCQNDLHFVCPFDIVFCKSDDCYTTISLRTQEQIIICKSLTQFSLELDGEVFKRVNQSYIINKHMVRRIVKKEKYVEMLGGGRIPYSRTIKELLSLLN